MVNPNRDLAQEALLAGNDPVAQRNRDLFLKREIPREIAKIKQRLESIPTTDNQAVEFYIEQVRIDIQALEVRFMQSQDTAFVEETFTTTTQLLLSLSSRELQAKAVVKEAQDIQSLSRHKGLGIDFPQLKNQSSEVTAIFKSFGYGGEVRFDALSLCSTSQVKE